MKIQTEYIYILEQLYNCSRIHYLYHILRRIANQAQRKKYILSMSKPNNSYFYQPLFCSIKSNQLFDKSKIEGPKSNGCYFDNLILKFEHVKLIIRPIEIKNSAWWFLFHTTACMLAFCGEKRKAFPLQF